MKRPWQPHVREDRILNPFAPVTEASPRVERIELEIEEDGVDEAGAEDSANLAKVDQQPPPGAD